MGGDPFQNSNGVLQQLDQMSYSYGMFNNQWISQVKQKHSKSSNYIAFCYLS